MHTKSKFIIMVALHIKLFVSVVLFHFFVSLTNNFNCSGFVTTAIALLMVFMLNAFYLHIPLFILCLPKNVEHAPTSMSTCATSKSN